MIIKYLVFTGDQYYPRPGFEDFRGVTETYEQALELAAQHKRDWTQIVGINEDVTFTVVYP